ncbi:hypothetical protein TrRE_jg7780, partial [Triparma retinervis]
MTSSAAEMMPTTIHCWSQPRSTSTALLYAFSQHPNVGKVFDEPLYGAHLLASPHLTRSGQEKDTVLAAQAHSNSIDACYNVLSQQSPDPSKPLTFIKHMSKHFPLLSLLSPPSSSIKAAQRILTQDKHIILLRDPLETIQSWSTAVEAGAAGATTLEELG